MAQEGKGERTADGWKPSNQFRNGDEHPAWNETGSEVGFVQTSRLPMNISGHDPGCLITVLDDSHFAGSVKD